MVVVQLVVQELDQDLRGERHERVFGKDRRSEQVHHAAPEVEKRRNFPEDGGSGPDENSDERSSVGRDDGDVGQKSKGPRRDLSLRKVQEAEDEEGGRQGDESQTNNHDEGAEPEELLAGAEHLGSTEDDRS